jgi:hypothetical protein
MSLFRLHSVFTAFFIVPHVLFRVIFLHRPWRNFPRTQRHQNTFHCRTNCRTTCLTLAEEFVLLWSTIGELLSLFLGCFYFVIFASTVKMALLSHLPSPSIILQPSCYLSPHFFISNMSDSECWTRNIIGSSSFGGCPVCAFRVSTVEIVLLSPPPSSPSYLQPSCNLSKPFFVCNMSDSECWSCCIDHTSHFGSYFVCATSICDSRVSLFSTTLFWGHVLLVLMILHCLLYFY